MRYYNDKKIVWNVVGKNGKKRSPWLTDAKKNDWKISVTSIAGHASDPQGLLNYYKNKALEAASQYAAHVSKDANEKQDYICLYEDPCKWYDPMLEEAEDLLGIPRRLGTAVHKAVETYFTWILGGKKGSLDVSALYQPYIKAVHDFCEEFSIKPKKNQVEVVLEDEETWTAGTMDMAGEGFGNKNVVFDWKTQKVNGPNPYFRFNYRLQLAAYRKMHSNKGVAAIVVLDTSGHPYKNGDVPKVYYKIMAATECKKLYGHYKELAKIVYASVEWERK